MQEQDDFSRIPSVDGLRAIAISLVLFSHALRTIHLPPAWKFFLHSFGAGQLGVTLFFSISGFLITTLLLREQAASGTISIKNFYIRRAFRILPAYYVYLGVMLFLAICGWVSGTPFTFLSAAAFFWNYNFIPDTGNASWFLAHCWSLCIEEQFYLICPLALFLVKPKQAQRLAILIILISPLLRFATYFAFPDITVRSHIGMMLHTRADALMFGALSAFLFSKPKFSSVLLRFYNQYFITICLFYFLVFCPLFNHYLNVAYDASRLLTYSFDSLFITLFMLWVIHYPQTKVGKLLNSPPLIWLGTISYSLYLWQQAYLTPLNKTFSGYFPLNVLFAILTAVCSYYCVERIFLRMRKRLSY